MSVVTLQARTASWRFRWTRSAWRARAATTAPAACRLARTRTSAPARPVCEETGYILGEDREPFRPPRQPLLLYHIPILYFYTAATHSPRCHTNFISFSLLLFNQLWLQGNQRKNYSQWLPLPHYAWLACKSLIFQKSKCNIRGLHANMNAAYHLKTEKPALFFLTVTQISNPAIYLT